LVGFAPWSPGEPNNKGGHDNCVRYRYDFLWNNYPCQNATVNNLCERSIGQEDNVGITTDTPSDTTDHWARQTAGVTTKQYFILPAGNNLENEQPLINCETHGGRLAIIRSEQDDISAKKAIAGTTVSWKIGLFRNSSCGSVNFKIDFSWLDGSCLEEFAPWGPGEPNNLGGHENCVYYWDNTPWLWNDAACLNELNATEKNNLLCERVIKRQEDSITSTERTFTSTFTSTITTITSTETGNVTAAKYFIVITNLTLEASGLCGDVNAEARLAIIRSEDDHVASKNINKRMLDFQIGLAGDSKCSGNVSHSTFGFRWVDGSCLDGFAPWAPGEPNNLNGKEGCVVQYRNGSWNDYPCSLEAAPVLCERFSETELTFITANDLLRHPCAGWLQQRYVHFGVLPTSCFDISCRCCNCNPCSEMSASLCCHKSLASF
jgi:hypothetical protein